MISLRLNTLTTLTALAIMFCSLTGCQESANKREDNANNTSINSSSSIEKLDNKVESVEDVKNEINKFTSSYDFIGSITKVYTTTEEYNINFVVSKDLTKKYCYIGNEDAMCIAYPKGEDIAFYSRFTSKGIKNLFKMILSMEEDETVTENNYTEYFEKYKENSGLDIDYSYSNGFFYINQGLLKKEDAKNIEESFKIAIPMTVTNTNCSNAEIEKEENSEDYDSVYNVSIGGYSSGDNDIMFCRRPDEWDYSLFYNNDVLSKLEIHEYVLTGEYKGSLEVSDSLSDKTFEEINSIDKDYDDSSYEYKDATKLISLPDMVKACIYLK